MSSTKAIYVGLRAVGLEDEEDRRDLYERVTGKRRLRAMSPADKSAVVDELRRLGFQPKRTPRRGLVPGAPRADLRFAHVMWRLLAEAGAVRKPGRAGLNAFVRARFEAKWGAVPVDIDALRDWPQINDVLEALKQMCRRHGIDVDKGK